jgi:hypothetical protein
MKPESVNNLAHRLSQKVEIRSRIKELQDEVAKAAMISLEEHLEDLKRIRDGAMLVGKFGPAVTAEIARGKACGLYKERMEVSASAEEPFNIVVFDGGDREPV